MTTSPTPRDEQAFVDKFVADSLMLIEMATDYARGGVENPAASANMRQLRIITNALSAALMAIPPVMAGVVPIPASMLAAQGPKAPSAELEQTEIGDLQKRVTALEVKSGA